jgi:hypothetical protein
MPEQKDVMSAGTVFTHPGVERRGAQRFSCDLKPSWRVLGRQSGESWGARVNDLSTSGISLHVPCWIRPGTVLVVRLHGAGERFSRPLPMRVMHATQQAEHEWLIGGMFVRPLNDEEVRQLVEAKE